MFFPLRFAASCGWFGLLALLALPASAGVFGDSIKGSGHVVSETRALSGYQAVALRGPFKVQLRQSGREGVELRGDDNLLPLVETTVIDGRQGRTLDIAFKKGVQNVSYRNEITLLVDVATLRAVAISGSGDIAGSGFKLGVLDAALSGSGDLSLKEVQAERLNLSISGSGDVELSGRSPSLSVSIQGSGDVSASQLASDDVSVRIAGSGDARVQARKTLNVSVAGSGDVTYSGDAQVTSSIAGSGSLRRR